MHLLLWLKTKKKSKMEASSTILKALLFLTFSVHLSSAGIHTLQYLYTALTTGRNVTAVGLVDGEQFVSYDSNIKKLIPKTEWIKKVEADDPRYWERETDRAQDQQEFFQNNLATVMQSFNQTEGVHTLQRMYGCERNGENTTRGYDQYGYDGEDFISLNLKNATWTAAKRQAVIFTNNWDPRGEKAKYWKDFLQNDCIDWLKKYVSYARETLERKVRPEASVFQKHSTPPEVVCHATGFFPKALNITWQKDGEEVHENVELRETLPNHDGSFQKRSILTVPAEELQKHTYTCVIQHSSLEKELVLEVPKSGGSDGGSDGAPIGVIVAVVAALVALVAVVAGIVVWKKKNSGERRKEADASILFHPNPERGGEGVEETEMRRRR
ncbi:BOLA class I histocompatibility antigen, alpha chain BL3-7 isoform X5 [Pangasianodon hypophthalmus]|uniref:BOLA class I histocompatibility antigen, alpha chain BL3-7 isoform X5 n=1 Tax=Pangasianodon hypophthalmus TaxID=310915 RepID=UPI0023072934|nr:BOLA class I histocompatibility antigen, alpha chain BL3-7 isoform X5 [Pangasianodon hypophthalmus]